MIPILSVCIDRSAYRGDRPERRHAAEEASREDAECIRALPKTEKLREAVERERKRRESDRPERDARELDPREDHRAEDEAGADRPAAGAHRHRLSPQMERALRKLVAEAAEHAKDERRASVVSPVV